MKTLRQICAATILSLTLALSVSAGDIHSPGYVPPPPPPGVTQTPPTTSITTTLILTILGLIR